MIHTEWNDDAKRRMEELRLLFRVGKGTGVTAEQKQEMVDLHDIEHADDLRRFGEALDWLTKLLYFHDPIDLVPMEVPQDEYDIEARMILRELAIRGDPTLKEITEVVHDIFVMEFEEHCAGTIDRPCYDLVARELVLQKEKWQNK